MFAGQCGRQNNTLSKMDIYEYGIFQGKGKMKVTDVTKLAKLLDLKSGRLTCTIWTSPVQSKGLFKSEKQSQTKEYVSSFRLL